MEVITLCKEVAKRLCLVNKNAKNGPFLLLPTKRDHSLRVSEQEAKIIFCVVLEENKICHSIETPTTKTYVQSGKKPISARLDVTIYNKRDPKSRMMNVELKAGNPAPENFRKDFEKLIREGIPGLWFHTFASANISSWRSLFTKVDKSFKSQYRSSIYGSHNITFAFVILKSAELYVTNIKLCRDVNKHVSETFNYNSENWTRYSLSNGPDRGSAVNPARKRPWQDVKIGDKKNKKVPIRGKEYRALIYCPRISRDSFLHLSTQGERYAIRSFCGELGKQRFKIRGIPTTSRFRKKYMIIKEVDITRERHNLQKEAKYWEERISSLNKEEIPALLQKLQQPQTRHNLAQ